MGKYPIRSLHAKDGMSLYSKVIDELKNAGMSITARKKVKTKQGRNVYAYQI